MHGLCKLRGTVRVPGRLRGGWVAGVKEAGTASRRACLLLPVSFSLLSILGPFDI